MGKLYDLELPTDNKVDTRIAWAHARLKELKAGTMPNNVGWFCWQFLVGLGDLCSDADRKLYFAAAKQFSDILQPE